MPGIIPTFYNVTASQSIEAGWKTICIIPIGTVTLTNALNPNQSMSITTPLMIGVGTQSIDTWEGITIIGTATVILNGSAVSS